MSEGGPEAASEGWGQGMEASRRPHREIPQGPGPTLISSGSAHFPPAPHPLLWAESCITSLTLSSPPAVSASAGSCSAPARAVTVTLHMGDQLSPVAGTGRGFPSLEI